MTFRFSPVRYRAPRLNPANWHGQREIEQKNCTIKVEQFPVDEKVDEIQVNVYKVDEI